MNRTPSDTRSDTPSDTPSDTRHLGRAEFIRLGAEPVRLVVDRGTLWVTQDGAPEDIELDAGTQRDFPGHAPLTVGTLGGDADLRLVRLPRSRPVPTLPALGRWLGLFRARVQA